MGIYVYIYRYVYIGFRVKGFKFRGGFRRAQSNYQDYVPRFLV